MTGDGTRCEIIYRGGHVTTMDQSQWIWVHIVLNTYWHVTIPEKPVETSFCNDGEQNQYKLVISVPLCEKYETIYIIVQKKCMLLFSLKEIKLVMNKIWTDMN